MSNRYDEYAVIDAQIKELTAKKDALKETILSEMSQAGEEKVETAVGKFSITKLKSWTYPEEVVQLGEDFKAAKAKAESTGDATFVENDSLRFTSTKL